MIGGGIDVGRAYMAQNRLQNACDAGVLAARRVLTRQSIDQDPAAVKVGEDYFSHNFSDGIFGVATGEETFSLSQGENGAIVDGQASVDVDNAIMGIFGFDSISVSVECSSTINATNTDVMLVLDTSLSMRSSIGGGLQRIDALRNATEDFYEIVQSGYVPGRNRVRFGVVPYAGTVNVGRVLMEGDGAFNPGNPAWILGGDPNLTVTHDYHTRTWNGSAFDIGTRGLDVSEYVASFYIGNRQAELPGAQPSSDGSTVLSPRWEGCIEERMGRDVDHGSVEYDEDLDLDLRIDLVPDPDDDDTRWRPYWYEVTVKADGAPLSLPSNCVPEAQLLKEHLDWAPGTPGTLGNLIQTFQESNLGWGTYHGLGLVWGARLMAPDGLFPAIAMDSPNGQPIQRHMVLMTDGQIGMRRDNYFSAGVQEAQWRWAPSSAGNINRELRLRGASRTAIACDLVKSRGITLWVVEFQVGTTVTNNMRNCATSPDHAFSAADAEELNVAFGAIAASIGGLRLTE